MAWGGNEGFGMGMVRSTSFGRKRVALTSNDIMEIESFDKTQTKKQCNSEASFFTSDKFSLEALPQEILIRILCGVEHDDLKRLFFVSKSIREATVIAKNWHFAYTTPKKTLGFRSALEVEASSEFKELERAPKHCRIRRYPLNSKNPPDISVALFTSAGEEKLARRLFLVGMEAEI